MKLSVQDICIIITSSIAVGALVKGIVSKVMKHKKRIDNLESECKRLSAHCEHNTQVDTLLIKANFALVDAFHQQGYNGPVTKAWNGLNDYMIEHRIE
jgi:hypothetical protein